MEEAFTENAAVEEDAIDEAAAIALPPITNALVLQECLPAEVIAKLRKELAFLEGYVWFSEDNVNRAAKCCTAAVSLSQGGRPPWVGISFPNNRRPASSGKPKENYRFFIDQIVILHERDIDMYDHDRALNAVKINGTRKRPQKYDDIPQQLYKSTTPSGYYNLIKKEFSWQLPVPDKVLDAVTQFAIQTPPDEFWIADYVQSRASYDPIIYAQFGDWHIEVARWE
jgi:hypothetical protein